MIEEIRMEKFLITFKLIDGSEVSFEEELPDLEAYKHFIRETDAKYATFKDGQVNLNYVQVVTYKKL
jgi:hypothetical protein